jgi:hypothetical protein
MYKNLYSSATTGNFSTVLVGPISGTEDFSFDYKIANYYSPYAPPASGTGNFVLEISTDLGNTWVPIETVDNNGVAGWQNKSYPISTYAIAGDYVKFRITANWLSGDYCIGFDNFNLASCLTPSGIIANNITTNSATITWEVSSSNPAGYQVYYSTTNTAPSDDESDIEETDSNSINLTDLEHSSTYYVWVRANCGEGDYSVWVGPYSFATECGAITSLPWLESFENVSIPAIPNCWLTEGSKWITTNNSYSIYDADARTGNQFLRIPYSSTNEYIWTLGFDMQAGVSYDFSFWWAGDTYSGWTGDVFYNTSQSSTGATQLGGSFVTSSTTTTKTYVQERITFIPTNDDVYYFAIKVTSTDAPWYLSFDDFRLELTPTCFAPTNIQASNITTNSATITWTESITTPESYDVYYSTSNTAPSDDESEIETSFTTSIELNDLQSSSTYYVWVRSNCGEGDYSTWGGPYSFATECDIISAYPYFEGFNNSNQPNCWTIIDLDDDGSSWEPRTTYSSNNPYEGSHMMVSEFSYPNNDWLISPQFKIINNNLKLDFYARSYSSSYLESFNVLVSKTGNSPADFTIELDEIIEHSTDWTNHEYILSDFGIEEDDEIYIAIQHVSYDMYALFIDAFSITEIYIPNDEAEILSYSIPEQVGDTDIDPITHEIELTMPYGTDLTELVATFTLSENATAKIGEVEQESGVTANDFTNNVDYTVTAEDGTTTQNWTVIVNVEELILNDEAEILTYSFAEQYSPAVIDDVNHTVTVVVNEGTSLDALVATFTLSPGASAKIGAVDQESGVTENNFTDPVIYTVTAEDGTTTQPWTVTVSVYVGIEDVENSALAIYPNPNNGNFTLDFTNINGKVNYQIYDTKGSIIISDDFVANGSAIKEVSLNLVPGVYFVKLITENQSLIEKLIIE